MKFGEFLSFLLKKYNIKYQEIYKATGLKPSHISNVLAGRFPPLRPEHVLNIIKNFPLDKSESFQLLYLCYYERMQNSVKAHILAQIDLEENYDLQKIIKSQPSQYTTFVLPLYKSVEELRKHKPSCHKYLSVPKEIYRENRFFVMVNDSSMYPHIHQNDILLVDEKIKCTNNDIVIVQLKEDSYNIKIGIYFSTNEYIIISGFDISSPILVYKKEEKEKLEIKGTVIQLIRNFKKL